MILKKEWLLAKSEINLTLVPENQTSWILLGLVKSIPVPNGAGYFFPQFVSAGIFFGSELALQEIFFQNHPPLPSKVKWSAPKMLVWCYSECISTPYSDSQQPFALVFDFSALLVDNLNWNSYMYLMDIRVCQLVWYFIERWMSRSLYSLVGD